MGKLFTYAQRLAGWRHFPLVASLVLIIAFMLGFYWRDIVRGAMCTGADDEHCTREWFAALGGWAAVIFAYMTITTMVRQREDANRHQQENVEIQILDRLDTAKRLSSQARTIVYLADNTIKFIGDCLTNNSYGGVIPRVLGTTFLNCVDDRDIAKLPYPLNQVSLADFVDFCDDYDATYREAVTENDLNFAAAVLALFQSKLRYIRDTFEDICTNQNEFVKKWEAKINER
jgi:hypothetical protein